MSNAINPPTPGPCAPGCQQSPILIAPRIISKPPLDFKFYWKQVNGTIHTDGGEYKVKFTPSMDNHIVLEGTTYLLNEYHFHKPGEHTFPDPDTRKYPKGKPFDAELHIVYKTRDAKTAAVLGVQIKRGDGKDRSKIKQQRAIEDEEIALGKAFDAKSNERPVINPYYWLPQPIKHGVRYQGSLTTPPYSEVVSWVVIPGPLVMLSFIFDAFFKNIGGHVQPPQDLNRRYLVLYDWPKRDWVVNKNKKTQ